MRSSNKLYLLSFGFKIPTTFKRLGRKLIVQELGVKELIQLVKWYYNLFPFADTPLYMSQEMYDIIEGRKLRGDKTVRSIFDSKRLICTVLPDEEIAKAWGRDMPIDISAPDVKEKYLKDETDAEDDE